MKYLLAILLLSLSITASAETMTADANGGVMYSPASLKLNYLPDDANRNYLTIYGHGTRYEQVQRWLETNDELKRLRDNSHYAAIDTASVLFKERYAASTPQPLTVRYQRPDGTIIKEWSELPMSAEAFIRLANAECFGKRRNCPDGNCPAPVIVDPPAQPVAPPAKPAPQFPWLLLALSTTIGCLSGVGFQWHKSTK